MTKKKITKNDANRYAIQYGYFYGLDKMKQDFEVTPEQEKGMRVELFKHVLLKVLEAKKEVAKLQASVTRLEAACRAGAAGGESQLMLELQPFDGWVISLLETNVSLLATVHNPETAGIRVNGLQAAFRDLWNKRMPGHTPYLNYPDTFGSTMAFYLP